MKKIFVFALFVLCAAVFSGCASVETSTRFNGMAPVVANATGKAHIYSRISGLYFFNLPIITGSVANPAAVSFFKDNCSVDPVFFQMNLAAAEMGACGVIDASSEVTSIPLLLPIFFWNVAEVSGTAVSAAH